MRLGVLGGSFDPVHHGHLAAARACLKSVPLDEVWFLPAANQPLKPGGPAAEVVLTIGWGAVSRIDLEPAACGDPQCDADHGYTGTASNDDLSVRVSEAADGAEVVRQVLAFSAALSEATAARSR
jgi:hypothetical protein